MLDVMVVCEGSTEKEFCRSVIAPKMAAAGVALVGTLVGKPQRKRGGIAPWPVYREELVRLAKERADRHVAVFVDYHRMPHSWPGRDTAPDQPIDQRGQHVEQALIDDLQDELGERFHPCVQYHEFESLLFVEPEVSALSIAVGSGNEDHERVADRMQQITRECGGSPEHINDRPEHSPSKRLVSLVPGYDKVAWGVTAAKDVELTRLRNGCPWLERWLSRIESSARN